jgi:hypothetical protein
MSKALKVLLAIAAVARDRRDRCRRLCRDAGFRQVQADDRRASEGRDRPRSRDQGQDRPAARLTPVVVVEGVTLSNAPWGEKRPMVSIERFEAKLQLVPLITSFGKRVVVDRVLLKGADIWLETDDKGVGNWKFDSDAPASATAAPPPATAGGEPPPDVVVMDVELQNVKLSFKAGRAAPTVVAFDQATMRGDTADGPRRIDGRGSYNKLGFVLAGQVGSVGALLNGTVPARSGDALRRPRGDQDRRSGSGAARDPGLRFDDHRRDARDRARRRTRRRGRRAQCRRAGAGPARRRAEGHRQGTERPSVMDGGEGDPRYRRHDANRHRGVGP